MKNLRLLVLAALSLAACGSPDNADLKQHLWSESDALTVCPGSSTLKGVDVSSYQGTINWTSVKGAGIKFAYAKATEGTGYKDPTFPTNWAGMKSAGVTRGAYHFFHAELDGKTQADYYLGYVGTIAAGDLPPMLDWEQVNPNNGGASCSTALANATAFINEIKAKTGLKTVIYTSPGIWNGYGCTNNFTNDPLWVADYFTSTGNGCYTSNTGPGGDCPATPSGWTSWAFWQYGDCGAVSGITGHVDIDVFNGDASALAAFANASCGGKPDGYYCGGDGPSGATDTLFHCVSNVASEEEVCAGRCSVGPDGDWCERHHANGQGPDIDGDGKADLCARASSGVDCWLSGTAPFSTQVSGPALSDASGWNSISRYTNIRFVDVNGDGKADVCGRGSAGEKCWLNSGGTSFPNATTQTLMTDAQGWDQAEFRETIQFADVNGDGKLDLCGRAWTSFVCYLWTGGGWTTEVDAPDMGDPQGWGQVQYYSTIVTADVNNDRKSDVCGRGAAGFECWLHAADGGFNPVGTAVADFSDASGGDKQSVYSTLQLGDVTGDGKLDLCGRESAGYFCYQGGGNGKFTTKITGPTLSDASGWSSAKYYTSIQLADVDGDGKADVCARGSAGVSCWLSNGSGFPTKITGPALTDTAGWSGAVYGDTLQMADVDGDGRADLCARGPSGWECWLSTGTGFASTAISTTLLADAQGWQAPKYLETIDLVGDAFGSFVGGTTTSGTTSGTTTSGTTTSGTTSTSSSGSGSTSSTSSSGSGSTSSSGSSSSSSSSSSSGSTSTSSTGTSTGGTTTSSGTASSTSSTTTSSGTTGTSATSTSTSTSTSGAGATGGAAAGATSTTGGGNGTVSGGCTSAGGLELFALLAVVGLTRRRR